MTTLILHVDDGSDEVCEYRLAGSELVLEASREMSRLMDLGSAKVALVAAALREQSK